MKQRKRIRYSEAQKAEMWDRWQKGDSMHAIAELHQAILRFFQKDLIESEIFLP
jgi:hypothetical protein